MQESNVSINDSPRQIGRTVRSLFKTGNVIAATIVVMSFVSADGGLAYALGQAFGVAILLAGILFFIRR